MRAFINILGAAAMLAGAVQADPAEGVWRTQPDRKALISHIKIAPCAAKLCGHVVAIFDKAGSPVTTKKLGLKLFWDMVPHGSGNYGGGTVYLPLLDVTAAASMKLSGNSLTVTACKGPVCDGQVWTRVK